MYQTPKTLTILTSICQFILSLQSLLCNLSYYTQQVCLCEPFSSSEIMVCHTIHEEQPSPGAFLKQYLVLDVSEEHLSFMCMT